MSIYLADISCMGEVLNVLWIFQIDKEQAELARSNFSILRKEAQAVLDLVGSTLSISVYSHTVL